MIDRVLIVGFGSIGKKHLRILRELLPKADIRLLRHKLCSEIPDYSNGFFNSLEEACNFCPQIAVIATPATFHLKTTIELLQVGCHLMIEKPISHSAEGVIDLMKIRDRQSVVVQVGYNLRFHESLMFYRDLILSERIGCVYTIRCEVGQYLPSWRPKTDYRKSVSANQSLGGGVLLELSHEFDYLRWIFGEVKSLSASLKKQSSLEIDVEDSAYLTMTFSSKNHGERTTASLCIDFIRHDTTRVCTAIGERGTLKWNAVTGVVELWAQGSDHWELLLKHQDQPDETYRAEWISFLNAVHEQKKPEVTIEDGLAVMKLIDAARMSHHNDGKAIAVQ